ncbi:MAG TPA: response regulator [Solirubrobacteraceae bacterium]|nr:response regulator [Solirubrobacteraceae bacterium]
MSEIGAGGARVLVIDDDEIARALLREMLERAGYEVREAPDGRAGLRAVYEDRPELVMLDVEMPELDGWETLARMRDLSEVPVLMVTARGGESERVRSLRGGGGADPGRWPPCGAPGGVGCGSPRTSRSCPRTSPRRSAHEHVAIVSSDDRLRAYGVRVEW